MRYFITDWAPNGTHELIITDSKLQVKHVIDEALFGIDVVNTDHVFYLDQTTGLQFYNDDTRTEYAELFNEGMAGPVWELTLAEVLQHIAVSPCQSVRDVIAKLKKAGVKIPKRAA